MCVSVAARRRRAGPHGPGPQLLIHSSIQVDAIFRPLQAPFDAVRLPGRSNFLSYNFAFSRIFQHLLGCPEQVACIIPSPLSSFPALAD